MEIAYPDNLPISRDIELIKKVVLANQVVIICGETGSGKTTQLPKMLLQLGYANRHIIGHTQPRRVAAKTIAKRIAIELNNPDLVGYKIRFIDKIKPQTRIKLMTDGILLQEIQTDKYLNKYSALIIDEAHERSLNIDFILGYLKTILPNRKDLRLIITSATIDNTKISKFFNDAPVINVEGKTYPVDIIYQPLNDTNLNDAIYTAVKSCLSIEQGNVLIFLPGEREIRDCLHFLKKSDLNIYEILPLFSRQNEVEQNRAFLEDDHLKIIISTNLAETSLTIPGIKFVIDSGLARIKRYNSRNKVEYLQVENISRASSKQRSGRAGRTGHGMCIRLFSEEEFGLRREFTEPELLRSNLANVILKLISFNLGDPEKFPFLDLPDNKAFSDGFKILFQLGALDEDNRITHLGRKISQIPLDCNLSRMLIAGHEFNCLNEVLIIVAYLAIIDPLEHPIEYQQLAYQRHQIWANKKSDFISILNLWYWHQNEVLHKKSNKSLLEKCRYNFVSLSRLRDWHELYGQLKDALSNIGMAKSIKSHTDFVQNEIKQEYPYQLIHQALLTGLLNNIGQKDLVFNHYIGTNSKKFMIHPSSSVDKSKWLVSANLTQTTKLYGKINAYIEPLWLVSLTAHLIKHTYANEHWDKSRGEVVATRSTLLMGLLIEKKSVAVGQLNPKLGREIFIKQALVNGEVFKNYAWLKHNNNVIQSIEKLEDKLRSSLLIMEDELFNFYDEHLPDGLFDIRSFDKWCLDNGEILKLDQQKFISQFMQEITSTNLYPDFIISGTEKIKLKYVFNPESQFDGVTAIIHLNQINQINPSTFTWLVPGLIRDKLTHLIKKMPKIVRTSLNPINEFITAFLEKNNNNIELDLISQFTQYINEVKSLKIAINDIANIPLPCYLNCHFEVLDNKQLIAMGDNLISIKSQLSSRLSNLVSTLNVQYEISDIRGWQNELNELLQEVRFRQFNHEVTGYVSLIVKNERVNLTVVDDIHKARRNTKIGLLRLVRYELFQQIKYLEQKQFFNFKQSSLLLVDVYNVDELLIDSISQIVTISVSLNSFPKDSLEYMNLCKNASAQFMQNTALFAEVLLGIANNFHKVKLMITNHHLYEDIELQLDDLVYPRFLKYIEFGVLKHIARYLQAILLRLDKYTINPKRDKELSLEVDELYDAWYQYVDDLESSGKIVSYEVYNFKYKIEELRVSLFAQELKTPYPVSSKRLWRELKSFS